LKYRLRLRKTLRHEKMANQKTSVGKSALPEVQISYLPLHLP